MNEVIVAFIAGGSATAIINGIFSLISHAIKKNEQEEDEDDVTKKALQYIMLYIIQVRAEEYIRRGWITVDDRRSLHKWHDLYHNGLLGNGDADLLMKTIDQLPIKYD